MRISDWSSDVCSSDLRQCRSARAKASLGDEARVTDAIFDAGYGASSRFYAEADGRLGMTPSVWRSGGRGVVIRHAVAETSLGPMLVAATATGICRQNGRASCSDRVCPYV